jgi:glutamine synthetase type III
MDQTLSQLAAERGIKYYLVSFTDLAGTQRAKLVPAAASDDVESVGAAFAGFAAWMGMNPGDPDLFAIADRSTLVQLPWKPEVGWMAADLRLNGAPLPQGPRSTLRRQIARAAERDLTMKTGVEAEFFLLDELGESLADCADRQSKPCYDQAALMRQYDLIAEICDAMAKLGWRPYQNDHEDGRGQFEMNWAFDDALITADRHVFFKFMVKTLAERRGLRATFMPKPFSDLTGNGCHVHVSLWRGEINLFDEPNDALGLSGMAYHFIGGLLNSAAGLTALLNPTVNSYKRINGMRPESGATWSPSSISYAGNNRTHMIRIPDGGRLELRLADGAVNPYLLQAGILAAGLDGLDRSRDPGTPQSTNAYLELCASGKLELLPGNLLDALRALSASEVLRSAFEGLLEPYVELKTKEWDAHMAHLSDWERAVTLDC